MDPTILPSNIAAEPDTSAPAQTFLRVCVFCLGGEQYAVDLRNIREVFPVESITPVPGMPLMLMGVTNLRGSVVPVVDLRLLLRLPQSEASAPFAVVLRHEEYQLAVLVDRSPEITTVLPEQFTSEPQKHHEESGILEPFLVGTLTINDQPASILDVARLMEHVEAEGMARDIE